MAKEIDVERLARLFEQAVARDCTPRCAIAFSGGLDSATIATVAARYADPKLITVGMRDSPDVECSRKVAQNLGLEHHVVEVDEKTLLEDYRAAQGAMPGTLVDLELMAVIYEICKRAAALGCDAVLFGSGAEELFVGYNKYYTALPEGADLNAVLREERATLPQRDIRRAQIMARMAGVEARTPFMDEAFARAVEGIDAYERRGPQEMKKPLLRLIAKALGVDALAVARQKKAMQYGSNVHRVFLRLAREGKISARGPRPPFSYD